MKARLAFLWAHHRLLLIGFVLACFFTLLFAIRTVVFTIYWANPAHNNQPLAGWMTPRYIAYSYGVPNQSITGFLGPEASGFHATLRKIAKAKGIPVKALEASLAAWLAKHPKPAQ